jgi:hypothetical protein
MLAELSETAQKYRNQLSKLDKVNVIVKYENVPRNIVVVSDYLVEYLKTVWWTNLVPSYSRSGSMNGRSMQV